MRRRSVNWCLVKCLLPLTNSLRRCFFWGAAKGRLSLTSYLRRRHVPFVAYKSCVAFGQSINFCRLRLRGGGVFVAFTRVFATDNRFLWDWQCLLSLACSLRHWQVLCGVDLFYVQLTCAVNSFYVVFITTWILDEWLALLTSHMGIWQVRCGVDKSYVMEIWMMKSPMWGWQVLCSDDLSYMTLVSPSNVDISVRRQQVSILRGHVLSLKIFTWRWYVTCGHLKFDLS